MKNFYLEAQANFIKKAEDTTRFLCGDVTLDRIDHRFFTTDGSVGYAIPKPFWCISEEFLASKDWNTSNKQIGCVFENFDSAVQVRKTGTEYIGNTEVVVLTSDDGTLRVRVDKKLFKQFDKPEFQFTATTPKTAVFIYWNQQVCGVVMPTIEKPKV